jgi:hypothetical protein
LLENPVLRQRVAHPIEYPHRQTGFVR